MATPVYVDRSYKQEQRALGRKNRESHLSCSPRKRWRLCRNSTCRLVTKLGHDPCRSANEQADGNQWFLGESAIGRVALSSSSGVSSAPAIMVDGSTLPLGWISDPRLRAETNSVYRPTHHRDATHKPIGRCGRDGDVPGHGLWHSAAALSVAKRQCAHPRSDQFHLPLTGVTTSDAGNYDVVVSKWLWECAEFIGCPAGTAVWRTQHSYQRPARSCHSFFGLPSDRDHYGWFHQRSHFLYA